MKRSGRTRFFESQAPLLSFTSASLSNECAPIFLSQLIQFRSILIAQSFRTNGLNSCMLLTQLATSAMLLALACTHTAADDSWFYWG